MSEITIAKIKLPRTENESVVKFVVKYGRQYEPALLPGHIERGELGQCFDNCVIRALKSNRRYSYVEGLARDPLNPEEWILHGWLTDGHYAFDPTWIATKSDGREVPVPSIYLGIEMDVYKVIDFLKATGYTGIIANAWRDPVRAKRINKDLPI